MSIYTDNGYKNRKDYLESVAIEFCVDKATVFSIASLLGSSEDFDGLLSMLDDISMTDEA